MAALYPAIHPEAVTLFRHLGVSHMV